MEGRRESRRALGFKHIDVAINFIIELSLSLPFTMIKQDM